MKPLTRELDKPLKETLELECQGHGPFLENLMPLVESYYINSMEKPSECDIILKVQNLAQAHYEALWKACTVNEKYVLFDIAQDGLVNSKNYNVTNALIEKGLLVNNGTIWMMNRSFRNYVLTTIRPEEALAMEREVLNNGAWSVVKGPLVLVVVALVSFLFLTQQDIYKQAIALLGTLTAVIPVIIRLLGTETSNLGKSSSKE